MTSCALTAHPLASPRRGLAMLEAPLDPAHRVRGARDSLSVPFVRLERQLPKLSNLVPKLVPTRQMRPPQGRLNLTERPLYYAEMSAKAPIIIHVSGFESPSSGIRRPCKSTFLSFGPVRRESKAVPNRSPETSHYRRPDAGPDRSRPSPLRRPGRRLVRELSAARWTPGAVLPRARPRCDSTKSAASSAKRTACWTRTTSSSGPTAGAPEVGVRHAGSDAAAEAIEKVLEDAGRPPHADIAAGNQHA